MQDAIQRNGIGVPLAYILLIFDFDRSLILAVNYICEQRKSRGFFVFFCLVVKLAAWHKIGVRGEGNQRETERVGRNGGENGKGGVCP